MAFCSVFLKKDILWDSGNCNFFQAEKVDAIPSGKITSFLISKVLDSTNLSLKFEVPQSQLKNCINDFVWFLFYMYVRFQASKLIKGLKI
jgi:hypothetical protein